MVAAQVRRMRQNRSPPGMRRCASSGRAAWPAGSITRVHPSPALLHALSGSRHVAVTPREPWQDVSSCESRQRGGQPSVYGSVSLTISCEGGEQAGDNLAQTHDPSENVSGSSNLHAITWLTCVMASAGRLSLAHARKSLAGARLQPMERRSLLDSLPIQPRHSRPVPAACACGLLLHLRQS